MMIAKILICGIVVGIVFKAAKFPIPAPDQIEGVIGIIGIYIGYNLWSWL